MKSQKKILFFSPYNLWPLHTNYELIFGHALMEAGHNLLYIACDKQLTDCELDHECWKCVLVTRRCFNELDVPFKWLGEFLRPNDKMVARDQVQAVNDSGLLTFNFNGYSLGTMVRSSLYSEFRETKLDLTDKKVLQKYRAFLESGIIVVLGLERVIKSFQPDILVVFNGRLFPHRIAYEVARRNKARCITHERGNLFSSLQFRANDIIYSYDAILDAWWEKAKQPLTLESLLQTHQFLLHRRQGVRLPWRAFSPKPNFRENISNSLSLDERPVVLVFTSSGDEIAFCEGYYEELFECQEDWIDTILELASKRNDFQYVIRVHPNSINEKGSNERFLGYLKLCADRGLPKNVRIVWPKESLSTYSLMDLAKCGITYGSTAGIEMACLGKPVLTVRKEVYHGLPFVISLKDLSNYEDLLNQVLTRKPSVEKQLQAYRFLHHYFSFTSLPFSAVIPENILRPQRNFGDIYELRKNPDTALRRIVDFILGGRNPTLNDVCGNTRKGNAFEEALFFQTLNANKNGNFRSIKNAKDVYKNNSVVHFPKYCYRVAILGIDSDQTHFSKNEKSVEGFCFKENARLATKTSFLRNNLTLLGHDVFTLYPQRQEFGQHLGEELGIFMGVHTIGYKILNNTLFRLPLTSLNRALRKAIQRYAKFRYSVQPPGQYRLLKEQLRSLSPDIVLSIGHQHSELERRRRSQKRVLHILLLTPSDFALERSWKSFGFLDQYDLILAPTSLKLKLPEIARSRVRDFEPAFEHQIVARVKDENPSRSLLVVNGGRYQFADQPEEVIKIIREDPFLKKSLGNESFERNSLFRCHEIAKANIILDVSDENRNQELREAIMLESLGLGKLFITRPQGVLPNTFAHRKQVVTYDGLESLQRVISHFQTQEKERQEIANAGLQCVLSENTYYHRAKTLITLIDKLIR